MKKIRAITVGLIMTTLFSLSSCGLVKVCIERPRDIANAYKYTDQQPLTADGLKHLLMDDTTHYKVVVIYSHCCEPCREQMRMTYGKLWNTDIANVRWYFVLDDCSSLKYDNTKYLRGYGINTPHMYYLRDDDPRFCTGAEDRFLNIAHYVFDHEMDLEDVIDGVPNIFIVNPQGKLKTEYRSYADGKVVVGNVDRLDNLFYDIQAYPNLVPLEKPIKIQDLDFDHRDTADWTWGNYTRKPRVCTPEGCH